MTDALIVTTNDAVGVIAAVIIAQRLRKALQARCCCYRCRAGKVYAGGRMRVVVKQ